MARENKSPWLAAPGVEMPGLVGHDYTVSSDGQTSRIKRKERPTFGGESQPHGRTWPATPDPALSPWLRGLPVALGPNQTLMDDGLTMRVKQKPAWSVTPLDEQGAIQRPPSSSEPPSSEPPTSDPPSSSEPPTSSVLMSSSSAPPSSEPPSSEPPESSEPPPESEPPP